jgi:hypothetical protein
VQLQVVQDMWEQKLRHRLLSLMIMRLQQEAMLLLFLKMIFRSKNQDLTIINFKCSGYLLFKRCPEHF